MKPVIVAHHISKKYHIGVGASYLTLRGSLINWARHPFGFLSPPKTKDFWALRDVSFKVNQGEVVGIIGRNGAGKSTLLKILSRITAPTHGTIRLQGRLASLLEVGTGFNPELSGRENIYLNGAILGMSRQEITAKFDEIVTFSGVNQFLDTPVKRYSSGMYVRLAFAVAAHLEPEILVVDEVLAVGDLEFQKKCLGKMSEVARSGRTVLFVSHNMAAIQNLCTRAILLEKGKVTRSGDTKTVIDHYLSLSREASDTQAIYSFEKKPNDPMQIRTIEIRDHQGQPNIQSDITHPFQIIVDYEVNQPIQTTSHLGILFYKLTPDTPILNVFDCDTNENLYSHREPGTYTATFDFPPQLFNRQELKVMVYLNIRSNYEKGFGESHDNIYLEFVDTGSFATKFFRGSRGGDFLLKIPCSVTKTS